MRFVLTFFGLYALVLALDIALLRLLYPRWWERRWLRYALYGQVPIALLSGALWIAGRSGPLYGAQTVGWSILVALFLYLGGLLIALLAAAPFLLARPIWQRLTPPPSPTRRAFFNGALAAVPAAGLGGVTWGLGRSSASVAMPQIDLSVPNLPHPLRDLRILHISDIHIGPYVGLGDLEEVLLRGEALRPDLLLITGDLCDHMPDFLGTLRLLESFSARLGTYCSLGNHEYHRGIRRVRKLFAQTSLPLLVNEGQSIQVDGASLYIAAADDPRYLHSPESHAYLRASVEQAMAGAPTDSFNLLLSHRPQAFDYAVPLGVDLTLAGHTHGFQLGFGGRSIFDSLLPDRYIWGPYRRNASQLYTTSGLGHWLPFRLGCPAEAPLLVLHSARDFRGG